MFNLAFIKENKYFVIIVLVLVIIAMYMMGSMATSVYEFFGGNTDAVEAKKYHAGKEKLKHAKEINDDNQDTIDKLEKSHESSETITKEVDDKEDDIKDTIDNIRDDLRMDTLSSGKATSVKTKEPEVKKVTKMTREKLLKARKAKKQERIKAEEDPEYKERTHNEIIEEYDRTSDEKRLTSGYVSTGPEFVVLDVKKTNDLSKKKINAIWKAYEVATK